MTRSAAPKVTGALPRPRDGGAREALPAGRRRVLFLNRRDTTNPEGGGSEEYLERIAAGLVARGHDVTVFCADYDGALREELRDGVRFVRRGGRTTVYLHAMRALRTGRLGEPDVVVDVQNGMPFLSPLVTRRPVVNVIHHVHREQWRVVFDPVRARIGWWLESRVAPAVYRDCPYVVVSQATRREVVDLGVRPSSVQVVHNGSQPPPPTTVPRSSTPLILVLGRLVPHKRVELAMRAVAQLRPDFPDLRLAIIGRGWWEDPLREAAAGLQVEEAVDFAGYVDEATKHALLDRAWVLAQPSLKEGWGLSVVEAAAHGTPTVAFADAGGLSESVHHDETGLLVHSTDEFVAALRRLLEDDALRTRLAEAGRRHADAYTWPAAVSAFEDLINHLTATVAR